MKIGLEFNLMGINHIVCDIKQYRGKTYANICIEKEQADYKIMEIDNNRLSEIKDRKLLSKIIPIFIFEEEKGG